jgi:hypothetical protein
MGPRARDKQPLSTEITLVWQLEGVLPLAAEDDVLVICRGMTRDFRLPSLPFGCHFTANAPPHPKIWAITLVLFSVMTTFLFLIREAQFLQMFARNDCSPDP